MSVAAVLERLPVPGRSPRVGACDVRNAGRIESVDQQARSLSDAELGAEVACDVDAVTERLDELRRVETALRGGSTSEGMSSSLRP